MIRTRTRTSWSKPALLVIDDDYDSAEACRVWEGRQIMKLMLKSKGLVGCYL